jgi:hypothetical protein
LFLHIAPPLRTKTLPELTIDEAIQFLLVVLGGSYKYPFYLTNTPFVRQLFFGGGPLFTKLLLYPINYVSTVNAKLSGPQHDDGV